MLGEGQNCVTPVGKLSCTNIQGRPDPLRTGKAQRLSTSHTHTTVCGLPPSNKVDFHFPACSNPGPHSRLRRAIQLARS